MLKKKLLVFIKDNTCNNFLPSKQKQSNSQKEIEKVNFVEEIMTQMKNKSKRITQVHP
jgi:hypothetical protein